IRGLLVNQAPAHKQSDTLAEDPKPTTPGKQPRAASNHARQPRNTARGKPLHATPSPTTLDPTPS
ncbi:hypothetical protein, partial [Corynebacterium resistens]|uniref:hypothetical protein n=1 Tax=Corynebacterium resistens TaxID=258224 RepID=UPI0023521CAE